jgi:hypothetical protein
MKYFKPILLSALLLTGFLSSSAQDERTIEYDGNVITIQARMDTLTVIDPETDEETVTYCKRDQFVLLNGNKIYQGRNADQPIGSSSQLNFGGFIEKLLEDELRSSKNTFHRLVLILDEKGEIAYFNTYFLETKGPVNNDSRTTSDMLIKLGDVKFKPARKDDVAVPYYIMIE